jgi:hypothetical protein
MSDADAEIREANDSENAAPPLSRLLPSRGFFTFALAMGLMVWYLYRTFTSTPSTSSNNGQTVPSRNKQLVFTLIRDKIAECRRALWHLRTTGAAGVGGDGDDDVEDGLHED